MDLEATMPTIVITPAPGGVMTNDEIQCFSTKDEVVSDDENVSEIKIECILDEETEDICTKDMQSTNALVLDNAGETDSEIKIECILDEDTENACMPFEDSANALEMDSAIDTDPADSVIKIECISDDETAMDNTEITESEKSEIKIEYVKDEADDGDMQNTKIMDSEIKIEYVNDEHDEIAMGQSTCTKDIGSVIKLEQYVEQQVEDDSLFVHTIQVYGNVHENEVNKNENIEKDNDNKPIVQNVHEISPSTCSTNSTDGINIMRMHEQYIQHLQKRNMSWMCGRSVLMTSVPGQGTPRLVTPGLLTPGLPPGKLTPGFATPGLLTPRLTTPGMVPPGMATSGLVAPRNGERPYSCNICEKKFIKENHLTKHMMTHNGHTSHTCSVCGQGFSQENNLAIHMKTHTTEERLYTCKICARRFIDYLALIEHTGTHDLDKRSYKCNICLIEFADKLSLRCHIWATHEKESFDNAKDSFNTEKESFYGKTHQRKRFKCSLCQNRFAQQNSLMRHMDLYCRGRGYSQGDSGDYSQGVSYSEFKYSGVRNSAVNIARSKTVHTCEICKQEFTKRVLLKEHVKEQHHKLKRFSCPCCEKRFANASSLCIHLRRHGKKPYECKLCKRKYALRRGLMAHVLQKHQKHGEQKFACTFCGKEYQNPGTLKNHLLQHNREYPLKCPICDSQFTEERKLVAHLKTHIPNVTTKVIKKGPTLRKRKADGHDDIEKGPHICKVCKREFNAKINLIKHERIHKESLYSCDFCDRVYTIENMLKYHLKMFHKGKTIDGIQGRLDSTITNSTNDCLEKNVSIQKRAVCTDSTETAQTTESAMSTQNGALGHNQDISRPITNQEEAIKNDNSDIVDNCDNDATDTNATASVNESVNASVNDADSDTHDTSTQNSNETGATQEVAELEIPHTCKVCNRTFTKKRNLILHMNKHVKDTPKDLNKSESRPYTCKICGKGYFMQSYLIGHMRIHNQERLYTCNVCKKGFASQIGLVGHMWRHSKKQFQCKKCHMGFNVKYSLTLHMAVHITKKPYRCPICCKKHSEHKTLMKHLIVHRKGPYQCNLCDQSFKRQRHLDAHMMIHNEEKDT